MAVDTYATLYPLVAGQEFKAANLNFIRTAISNRATVIGATVTLPAVMADGEPIDLDDELFHDWLDAARTAVEALIAEAGYYKWDTSALEWVAWASIAELLTYVHGQWSTATRNSSGHDVDAWMPYDDPSTLNQFLIGYVNELYYCCECLSIHEVAVTCPDGVPAIDARSHVYLSVDGYECYLSYRGAVTGGWDSYGWSSKAWGDGGTNPTDCAAATTQNFTLDAGTPIKPGTVTMASQGGANYFMAEDDGAGGMRDWSGGGSIGVTGGTIDYATGAVVINLDGTPDAGHMHSAYEYGGTLGATMEEAYADAWDQYNAAGYPGAAGDGTHVVVPDTEWDLLLLWGPWRYERYSGAPGTEISCAESGGVEFVLVSSGGSPIVDLGYARFNAGWCDETVHVILGLTGIEEGAFGSDADTTDYWPKLELRDPASYPWYGKNTFDGYCNTAYMPL